MERIEGGMSKIKRNSQRVTELKDKRIRKLGTS